MLVFSGLANPNVYRHHVVPIAWVGPSTLHRPLTQRLSAAADLC